MLAAKPGNLLSNLAVIEYLRAAFNHPSEGSCKILLHQHLAGQRRASASHNHTLSGRRKIGGCALHKKGVLDRDGVADFGEFNRGLKNVGELHAAVPLQQRQPSAARAGHHPRPDADLIRSRRRVRVKLRLVRTRAHVVQHTARLLLRAIHDDITVACNAGHVRLNHV